VAAPYGLFGNETELPRTTRSNLPYEVESLTYREQWIEGANQTTVVCRVKTFDSPVWVRDMVGRVYTTGAAGSRVLRRDLPERNPFYPEQWCTRVEQFDQGGDPTGDPNLLVQTGTWADADPTTGASGWPVTLWARYRCTFTGMPFKLLTDDAVDDLDALGYEAELNRYVERRRVVVAREQQFPGGNFRIIPTGEKVQQTGFKVVPMADVEYRWWRVPVDSLPLTALNGLIGTINSAAFDTGEGGYNFPAGTLLYTGFDDNEKMFDPDGVWCCMPLVVRFRWKGLRDSGGVVRGWNYFLNNKAQPVQVSLDGTTATAKPYEESADHVKLFRCEP